MSLPSPIKCHYCDAEVWAVLMEEHISNLHGYWAGYKYRTRHNLHQSNWLDLAGNVARTVILISVVVIITVQLMK